MDLAQGAPMTQVRAIATLGLKGLQTNAETSGASAAQIGDRAHRQLLASDIKRFVERPFDNMRPAAIPAPPPGAPIGDYGMDYLLGLDACGWYWR
jgi:hypothetical protein